TVYVGSWSGDIYALDAATGKVIWTFSSGVTGKRGAVRIGLVVAHDYVMFGDQLGRFFTLNKADGSMARPPLDIGEHPLSQITGSPIVYEDRIYVPIASREENAAADPNYPCCTFRGSLVAIDIPTGAIVWRFYAVDNPQENGLSSAGVKLSGPSGVGIWSTPAIDPEEGLIYLST